MRNKVTYFLKFNLFGLIKIEPALAWGSKKVEVVNIRSSEDATGIQSTETPGSI